MKDLQEKKYFEEIKNIIRYLVFQGKKTERDVGRYFKDRNGNGLHKYVFGAPITHIELYYDIDLSNIKTILSEYCEDEIETIILAYSNLTDGILEYHPTGYREGEYIVLAGEWYKGQCNDTLFKEKGLELPSDAKSVPISMIDLSDGIWKHANFEDLVRGNVYRDFSDGTVKIHIGTVVQNNTKIHRGWVLSRDLGHINVFVRNESN